MAFHVGGSRGRQSSILPAALNGQFLTDRVGRGDALSFSVAGAADSSEHGIDFVSVALGVG